MWKPYLAFVNPFRSDGFSIHIDINMGVPIVHFKESQVEVS